MNTSPSSRARDKSVRPAAVTTAVKARGLGIEQLRARYKNENAHSGHVTRSALRLFDATRRWLGMNREDRRLLEAASRLHDVAYHVDPVHHLERGAEIVWREGLKGFSAEERACVAAAMLFHAGKWKTQLDHPILQRLREPQRAWRLGAYLRVADGLDWGHVQDAAIVGVTRSRTLIRIRVRSDWFPGNLARAGEKADLWRELFPLDLRFVQARARRPIPMVERGVTTIEAARRLLSVQYRTILADVDGAVAGDDPEPLHRIRVAIRRLRNLLRVFRKQLPDTGPIDKTLGSLGDALGTARDLDVWTAFLHGEPVTRLVKGNRRWRAFVQHHEQVRGLEQATVRRELRGAHFHGLRRRMASLLRTQLPALSSPGKTVAVDEFAAKKWLKDLRRVRELGSLRHSQSPDKLHRLRVALRRARYLGEMFGPALGARADKLTRRLHQVEKPLAEMHDLDVGESFIQKGGPAAPRALVAWLHTRREEQRNRVEPSWRRLVALQKKVRRELQAEPVGRT